MDIFGIPIQYAALIGLAAVFFGYRFWKIANEDVERPNPNKEWSPDVDQAKGAVMRNHGHSGER